MRGRAFRYFPEEVLSVVEWSSPFFFFFGHKSGGIAAGSPSITTDRGREPEMTLSGCQFLRSEGYLRLGNDQPLLASRRLTLQAPLRTYEVTEGLPTAPELVIGGA